MTKLWAVFFVEYPTWSNILATVGAERLTNLATLFIDPTSFNDLIT
jgi:hypothetical protein